MTLFKMKDCGPCKVTPQVVRLLQRVGQALDLPGNKVNKRFGCCVGGKRGSLIQAVSKPER